jgi:NitT/TauT family transport system substrate-binding protein
MKITTRVFRQACLAASAAALMAATVQTSGAAELKTWRDGIVKAKSDAGFIMMASKKGFDKQQGVKIDLKQFKGDSLVLKAFLAGELDSYEGSPGSPILAAARGADIKLVGCFWPTLTYGLYSKESLKSIHDTNGKTFAISGPGSLPDLLARVVLEENNIPASAVHFAIMGGDASRFQALVTGVVDVAAASTEFVPLAKENHLKLLVHAHDAAPKYLRFCMYMHSKTIAEHKDEAAHFLAAKMMGLRYALSHRDEEIALAQEVTKVKPSDPRAPYIFDEVKRLSAIDPEMHIPMDKLAWMQDLLVKTGNLKKPIDLKKLVDGSVRAEALKLVAKK